MKKRAGHEAETLFFIQYVPADAGQSPGPSGESAYPRNESRIPAATAEPTTPATLGPMACISR